MIRKKIKYLVFIIGLFFAFSGSALAVIKTCEYSDGNLTAKFDITGSNYEVSDAIINGTLESTDETNIENESQGIENWDSIFKAGNIYARGVDYYKSHNACPPYAIFVDRIGQFDFAVFNGDHYEEFKEYGESKQGYAIMSLVSTSEKDEPIIDGAESCKEYTTNACDRDNNCDKSCEHNTKFACIWNETKYGDYCNTDNLLYVTCGGAFDIPDRIPKITSFLVNLLRIATPIILIIVSLISLVKALAASKEDEIKKAQQSLIKKMIAAALIFFVTTIVKLVVSIAADSGEADDVSTCIDCFLNNDCSNNIYYKTAIGSQYFCTFIEGEEPDGFKCY